MKTKNEIGEYRFKINENEKCIKKFDTKSNKQINIIFSDEQNTDLMSEIISELSKWYVEEIMKKVEI